MTATSFTPHARGSTLPRVGRSSHGYVYPACAGIDHILVPQKLPAFRLPRMRGDRPKPKKRPETRVMFTPHARGSTFFPVLVCLSACVYPACAGIDPHTIKRQLLHGSLPRMRGDRPYSGSPKTSSISFTPHARGSTSACKDRQLPPPVYPACAGIDLPPRAHGPGGPRLPRMRGDRPCWCGHV